jgi:hypothetical protein
MRDRRPSQLHTFHLTHRSWRAEQIVLRLGLDPYGCGGNAEARVELQNGPHNGNPVRRVRHTGNKGLVNFE